MSNEKNNHYIGVDVSKAVLDVCILPNTYFQFENNLKGITQFIKKMSHLKDILIVMEASGGYEKLAAQRLSMAKLAVSVVNPRQIRNFAKAMGKLAKTDRIDAYIIASFAEKMQPSVRGVCNQNQQKITELHSRRKQLVDMIGMEKNRLDKASSDMKKSLKKVIDALEKELKAIEAQLQQNIKQDPEYAEKDTLLTTIKGVGKVVSAGVLAYLPEIGKLTHKQISALAGLAPLNQDSGTYRGNRIIWGGRANLRAALYMGTLVAVKHNPQIKSFYLRLCSKGKPKKVALTACMHKLVIIMNAMIKNNQPWQFNHC